MLLTFRSFADIPNKIHVFYEQAFETLFARHDALKDTFKRQFSTNLQIDIFKSQFSAFCLLTYDKEIYTFSEAQILEYIGTSKKITGSEFDSAKFLKDLFESVCMLQRDGLSIVFSHRSFQEFFAARFLARMSRSKAEKLLPKYFNRISDGTGAMLYDMNNDLVEECFLVPRFLEFKNKLLKQSKLSGIEVTCKTLTCKCKFSTYGASSRSPVKEIIIRFGDAEYSQFTELVMQLFNVDLNKENDNFNKLVAKDHTASMSLIKSREIDLLLPTKKDYKSFEIYSTGWKIDENLARSLEKTYANGGYIMYRTIVAKRTIALCEKMIETRNSRNKSLDGLLGV